MEQLPYCDWCSRPITLLNPGVVINERWKFHDRVCYPAYKRQTFVKRLIHVTRVLPVFLLLAVLSGCAVHNIRVNTRTANNLTFLYDHVQTEFAFCVFGKIRNKEIVIDHIELPFIYSADHASVTWEACTGPTFLGIGHSHPPEADCLFSDADFVALLQTDAPLGFLLCRDQRLVWYSKFQVAAQIP